MMGIIWHIQSEVLYNAEIPARSLLHRCEVAIEAGSTPGDGESGECFSSLGEGGPNIDFEMKLINSERWG
jgi:hypothetical protein